MPPKHASKSSNGKWLCRSCLGNDGNPLVNFAFRDQCMRCSKPKSRCSAGPAGQASKGCNSNGRKQQPQCPTFRSPKTLAEKQVREAQAEAARLKKELVKLQKEKKEENDEGQEAQKSEDDDAKAAKKAAAAEQRKRTNRIKEQERILAAFDKDRAEDDPDLLRHRSILARLKQEALTSKPAKVQVRMLEADVKRAKDKLEADKQALAKKQAAVERALQSFAEAKKLVASSEAALQEAEQKRADHKEEDDEDDQEANDTTSKPEGIEEFLDKWQDMVSTIAPEFLLAENLQGPDFLSNIFQRVGQAAARSQTASKAKAEMECDTGAQAEEAPQAQGAAASSGLPQPPPAPQDHAAAAGQQQQQGSQAPPVVPAARGEPDPDLGSQVDDPIDVDSELSEQESEAAIRMVRAFLESRDPAGSHDEELKRKAEVDNFSEFIHGRKVQAAKRQKSEGVAA